MKRKRELEESKDQTETRTKPKRLLLWSSRNLPILPNATPHTEKIESYNTKYSLNWNEFFVSATLSQKELENDKRFVGGGGFARCFQISPSLVAKVQVIQHYAKPDPDSFWQFLMESKIHAWLTTAQEEQKEQIVPRLLDRFSYTEGQEVRQVLILEKFEMNVHRLLNRQSKAWFNQTKSSYWKALMKKGLAPWIMTHQQMKQLVDLVTRFDRYGVIHGDLSLRNILYSNENNHFVITDFGFSVLSLRKSSFINDVWNSNKNEVILWNHILPYSLYDRCKTKKDLYWLWKHRGSLNLYQFESNFTWAVTDTEVEPPVRKRIVFVVDSLLTSLSVCHQDIFTGFHSPHSLQELRDHNTGSQSEYQSWWDKTFQEVRLCDPSFVANTALTPRLWDIQTSRFIHQDKKE